MKLAAEGNPLEVGDLETDWTFEQGKLTCNCNADDFQALIRTTTVGSLYKIGASMFASGPSTTAARQCMRSFSTTRLCRSKIGSAPLSVPQEVKFSILPPAVVKTGRGVSRDGLGSTVEISGPLGTMKMNIPAYMSIEENNENNTRTLSILDANDRKQREMWGE